MSAAQLLFCKDAGGVVIGSNLPFVRARESRIGLRDERVSPASPRTTCLRRAREARDLSRCVEKDRLPSKRLSPLVFGTLRLHEAEEPSALLTLAWELGIRAFDCAAVYGGGECERRLGAWLRDPSTPSAARREAFVVTKGGCGAAETSWAPQLSYGGLDAELASSLDRLGRVDLYLLHRDDPSKPCGEIVETVHRLCAARGVSNWGVSNWSTRRLAEAREYAAARGLAAPSYSSVQDSLALPRRAPWPGTEFMTRDDRDWYAANPGVPVISWEVLAKGFLAGKWDESHAPLDGEAPPSDVFRPGDDMAAWREQRLTSAYLTSDNFERRARATKLGAALGVGPEHVALAWCMRQRYASHVCVATVCPEHLVSNAKALDLALSSDDVAWLAHGDPALMPDLIA